MLRPSSINVKTQAYPSILLNYMQNLSGLITQLPFDEVSGSAARAVSPALALGRNIVLNGDFATDTIWVKGTGWTISGGAAHALLSPSGGLGNLEQSIPMVIGKTYRIIYTISNYVAGVIRCLVGTTGTGISRNANGTYTQDIVCSGNTAFYLQVTTLFTGDIDNLSVQETNIPANALSGVISGAIPNQPGVAGTRSYFFDGINDYVNWYTPSLNSAFNPDEGTLIIFAKVQNAAVWTDGSQRRFFTIQVDGNNSIQIRRSTTNNLLEYVYLAGGVLELPTKSTSTLNWMQLVITWSKVADEVRAYFNGALVSVATVLGQWVGNVATSQFVVGAFNSSGAGSWSGNLTLPTLYNRPLTAAEILRIAQYAGVAA